MVVRRGLITSHFYVIRGVGRFYNLPGWLFRSRDFLVGLAGATSGTPDYPSSDFDIAVWFADGGKPVSLHKVQRPIRIEIVEISELERKRGSRDAYRPQRRSPACKIVAYGESDCGNHPRRIEDRHRHHISTRRQVIG